MDIVTKKDFKMLSGEVTIPADKSISHRAIIFSALAKGKSIIKNFSNGQDPHSTLNIFKQLGVQFEEEGTTVVVKSSGLLQFSNSPLDCGNSGTTMRLMAGVLAGQKFNSTLIGDDSLSKRPMKRVIAPLEQMGGDIQSNNFKAPLIISGKELKAINYNSPIASAQVKSCILLAGLNANGITTVTEPYTSRNHTEIMLKAMGANLSVEKTTVSIEKSELEPIDIEIPGDISSAAYFICAGLIVPNSEIILKNVGLNPTRTGIIDIFKQAEIDFKILNERRVSNELMGDIEVNYTKNIKPFEIKGDIIPRLIDEVPILAILASQANGKSIVKDAKDLRNKESDRISTIVEAFKKLDINIVENEDGFIIEGKKAINKDVFLKTHLDHRLAMSYYVLSLINKGKTEIEDMSCINTSFPEFLDMMGILKD